MFMTYAHRPAARLTQQHDIADGDRTLLLGDAAFDVFLRVGRTFFFTIMTCSTSTLPPPALPEARGLLCLYPRPVITRTWSLRRISTLFCISLNPRCQLAIGLDRQLITANCR